MSQPKAELYSAPRALHSVKLIDLDEQHINKISDILSALKINSEVPADGSLSYLADLWIAEHSKGEGANKDAMRGIESIVFSAQNIKKK